MNLTSPPRLTRVRIFFEYWRINIADSIVHWTRHEVVPMLVGYLVAALTAVGAFMLRIDQRAGLIEVAQAVVGTLAVTAIAWLAFLVVFWNPARLWDQQRNGILSLLAQFEETRDLSGLIVILREQQARAIEFMRRIQIDGLDIPDDEFWEWVKPTGQAIRDAGPKHEALYTSTLASMSLTANTHSEMLAVLVTLIGNVISELATRNDSLRTNAMRRSRFQ